MAPKRASSGPDGAAVAALPMKKLKTVKASVLKKPSGKGAPSSSAPEDIAKPVGETSIVAVPKAKAASKSEGQAKANSALLAKLDTMNLE
eukprot:8572745-Alexandrium_andersonii.AAC.1